MTTWTRHAAHSLTEALTMPGVEVAAGAVDGDGAVTSDTTTEDQRFEIGSVTKTMTATVLALLVGEGLLSLDDDIGRWLSAGRNGAITVRQLATHTSGLPSMARNVQVERSDPDNPWAGYGFEQAEAGLRESEVAPGNPWRYSNLGYQLLGLIVQRANGQDYAALLAERLFEPLGMRHSGVGSRGVGTLLPGHADGHETPRCDHPLGAGGVEATIQDLTRYAQACLFPPDTALGEAIRLAQTQGLAWQTRPGGYEHSGGTGGFSSCVSIDHDRGRAVTILVSNQGSPAYSSRLKQAAQLVLAGEDPRDARTPEPWSSWQDDARDVTRAFLAGDIARVHARLAAPVRGKITADQLERAWTQRIRPAGPAGEIAIVHHEIAATGAVVVDVAIPFAADRQRLRLVVLPSGQLGGLAFVPVRG
ncbi:MAG TPA: serine hydrolase domain-containing protein [Pseudonocardiaceae bacterium]|jgi:CubicO group peptidase (beta-lactamase class C family)|nr:serine hydrolase domain-containing protein [Pseudonocardiaceae bacterium]